MPMHATPTFKTEAHRLVTQVAIAALNDCYRELTPYIALANSYLVRFHNVYQCQGHTH